MILYLRTARDMPHGRMYAEAPQAICGVDLSQAKSITEEQALVHLGNVRCHSCFPGWSTHNRSLQGHAA